MAEQDTFSPGATLFERDGVEYRRVAGLGDVYEYNRLSNGAAIRFADGGIADGYVMLRSDGTPAAPAISYVVLDQYIKRDASFLGDSAKTPLAARDSAYYSAAEQALRDLERVVLSPDGRSVTLLSEGRRVRVDLVPPYMVVDRSYREFFSLVDVRAGMRLFTDVELKVDLEDRSVFLIDRRGSSTVLAELPYARIQDLESGEIFEPEEKRAATERRAPAPAASVAPASSPGAPVLPRTRPSGTDIAFGTRAQPLSQKTGLVEPVVRAAESALPAQSTESTTKGDGAASRSSFLRLIMPEGEKTSRTSSEGSIPSRRTSEAKAPDVPVVPREGSPRLVSETRRDESTERIYELPQSKVRLALSYKSDGTIVVVSVQAGMSLYPGGAILPDWEPRLLRAREHWKKFRYDDAEQDITAAKRIVVARARELLAYAFAAAAFPAGSLEARALEVARLKLKADTEARYGKVFK